MTHRQFPRLRVIGALIAIALAFSVFFSSAATLGGVSPGVLGGTGGDTQHISAVQLEWNRSESIAPAQLRTLRLSTAAGETFAASDTVDVTTVGAGPTTCSATAAVLSDTSTVDLTFTSCSALLWDLSSVAVSISGTRGATTLEGNLGELRTGLSSFDGAVVDTEASLSPGYTTVGAGQSERVATATLGVSDASVQQLVGRRAVLILWNTSGQTTSYVGNVGTRASNQGFWADTNSGNAVPTVTVELSTLVPGGESPRTADVAEFRIVLLQPQRLGAGQTASNTHAIVSAGAEVKSSGGGGGETTDVETALEPVGLDPRLSFSQVDVSNTNNNTRDAGFCYTFKVTNTTPTPVEWEVTFDTTKPPLWGLDPTVVGGYGQKGLWREEFKNARTAAYDSTTGLWNVAGRDGTRILAGATNGGAASSVQVKYCAWPTTPAPDPSTFAAAVSLQPGSRKNNVEFRAIVTSQLPFFVPWGFEIDFADYVCSANWPLPLQGQNVTLTPVAGSQSKYTVTPDGWNSLVSSRLPRDFTFARYNPNGQPFLPGECS